MKPFFRKIYQEFCRRLLNKLETLNTHFINDQIDEAKHQIGLGQKKLERGLKNGY